MTPERVTYDLAEALYNSLGLDMGWSDELPSILEKQCADRGDSEGLAFWVAVHTEILMLESYFDLTGELPAIKRDDPAHYLAMMIWDAGWGTPDMALWSARRYDHDHAIRYLERMTEIWDQVHAGVAAQQRA